MNQLYEIIGQLLAAVLVGLLAYLTPKARAWLEANTSKITQAKIQELVTAFAQAAEQMLHDQDPSGQQRKQYVLNRLTSLGIEITETVVNMIEAEVWAINTQAKQAQVQVKAISAGTVGGLGMVHADGELGTKAEGDVTQ